MTRKRYLLITDSFLTKDWILEVFEEIQNDIGFDIDIVKVGGKVYMPGNYCLCFDGHLRDTIVPTPKSLRGKPVPEGTSFIANIESARGAFEIRERINAQNYDAIVNIMTLHDYDLLLFDWVLDCANVPLEYPTKLLPLTPDLNFNDIDSFGKLDKNLLITLLKQLPNL